MMGGTEGGESMNRVIAASSIVVVVALTALVPGSGLASSSATRLPAGLVAAIHARLGAGAIRSASAAGGTVGDPYLGLAVSLSADGTTALVGAPGVAGEKGAAYIFHTSDAGSWTSASTPVATLTHGHRAETSLFGLTASLSADGTTAFVGAPLAGGGLFGAGAIYEFHASAEDAWASSSAPTATLTIKHSALVGISIALTPDGKTLVVGVPFYDSLAGGAYVFHVASEGAWATTSTPTALLTNSLESRDDLGVGFAVAISGDGTTALISDDGNPGGGGAYVYNVSADDAWTSSSTPTAILTDASSGQDDGLGASVALSADGTVALLGAPGAASKQGAADVFHSSGEAAWATTTTPTATLSNGGGSGGDEFGVNLAVSTDGTTALVFAPGAGKSRGAAYVFRASGEGAWADTALPNATLTNSAGHPKDKLGIGALSNDGATVLAGAPGVDLRTGAAEVFHVADESSWATSGAPNAILTDKALAACVVPKLKGLRISYAKYELSAGRCSVGKVIMVHSKSKKGHGRVLSQSKKAGKRLAIGAKVVLRVGK
jgi:hypothetical protein